MYVDAPINYIVPSKVTSTAVPALPVNTGRPVKRTSSYLLTRSLLPAPESYGNVLTVVCSFRIIENVLFLKIRGLGNGMLLCIREELIAPYCAVWDNYCVTDASSRASNFTVVVVCSCRIIFDISSYRKGYRCNSSCNNSRSHYDSRYDDRCG